MSASNKERLLRLEQLFLQETDEQHPLSLQEICDRLVQYGCEPNRKTLYDDFAVLSDIGIEILQDEKHRYYTESRLFADAELKLLADAVASSRFLTEKKSRQLIGKLASLGGKSTAGALNRSLLVAGKARTENEAVLYSVDALHNAIREDREVQFLYFDWTSRKERYYRRDGAFYLVSPWALMWDDERYYLLGYDAEQKEIRHFRVDKMEQIRQTARKRMGEAEFRATNPEGYTDRVFGMFSGREEIVTLRVQNDLAGVMIDRFGTDVPFLSDEEEPGCFRVPVKVVCSPNFYGWVFSFGGRMRILSPDTVREEFAQYLQKQT